MLKQMVQWKGPDGKNRNKTFYFSLTEFEVAGEMKLEELHDRFLRFQEEVINDEQRNLTHPEIRELLDMVKTIIRYAYGELRDTSDGAEMWKEQQDPDIWNHFVASGGFNAFIWYLFEGGGARANKFMENIWPDSYKDGIQNALGGIQNTDLPEEPVDDGVTSLDDVETPEGTNGLELRDKLSDYSKEELLKASDEEFQVIVDRFTQGKNTPYQLLSIGMQRMGAPPDHSLS